MMTASQLYLLDSVGVAIQRGALNQASVDACNTLIEARRRDAVSKFAILDIDRALFDLIGHPWVMDVCQHVIGEHFRFDHAFGLEQPLAKPNLHGGPLTCLGSCFYSGGNASGAGLSVGRLSVGFALTPQTRQTGGFAFVPGSHKSSYPMHGSKVLADVFGGSFDHEHILIPELEPGDAIVFPDCLVHGTAPWRGGYSRRALYYMYSPGYMAWRPYAEIERYAAMATNDLQRQLLRPPYVACIEEDGYRVGNNTWRDATMPGRAQDDQPRSDRD